MNNSTSAVRDERSSPTVTPLLAGAIFIVMATAYGCSSEDNGSGEDQRSATVGGASSGAGSSAPSTGSQGVDGIANGSMTGVVGGEGAGGGSTSATSTAAGGGGSDGDVGNPEVDSGESNGDGGATSDLGGDTGTDVSPGAGGAPGAETTAGVAGASTVDEEGSGGAGRDEAGDQGTSDDEGAGGGDGGNEEVEDTAPECPKPEGEICHEFFANDNSQHQILYVNEFDPSLNWTQPTQDTNGGNSPRQLELVDNPMATDGRAIMVSVESGYEEYDAVTHELLDRVDVGAISVRGAQRLPDGNTVLGIGDAALRVVDSSGATVGAECNLPGSGDSTLRILSRDAETGFIYYGRGLDVFAVNLNCEQQWTARFPDSGSKAYRVLARPDGGAWATTGDPSSVIEFDSAGRVVSEVGGKSMFPGLVDFFSGFDVAESGNIVVANWWGHITNPPQEGPHIVELNAANEMVWRWGTQTEATNITNVLLAR